MPPRKPSSGLGYRGPEIYGTISGRSGGSRSWKTGGSGNWGSAGKSRADGLSWRKDVGSGSGKGKLGKKSEEEEVTSPMKDVQATKLRSSAAKTELFPTLADGADLSLVMHDGHGQHGGEHINSTMLNEKEVLVIVEKADGKDKALRKFKRTKRDEKKNLIVKSLEKQQNKKRGGNDLMAVELDDPTDVKRSKLGSVMEEVNVNETFGVELSEQLRGSK